MSHHEINYEELIAYLKLITCENEDSSPFDDLFILRQAITNNNIGNVDEILSIIGELDKDIKSLIIGETLHLPRPNNHIKLGLKILPFINK
jgi:hypothetical protein